MVTNGIEDKEDKEDNGIQPLLTPQADVFGKKVRVPLCNFCNGGGGLPFVPCNECNGSGLQLPSNN